jgi:type II secretion system protein D
LNPNHLRLIGTGLTVASCALAYWHAEHLSAEVRIFGRKPKTAAKPAAEPLDVEALSAESLKAARTSHASPEAADAKVIKLNYFSSTWDTVLRDIARQSGRQLVMDQVPPGRFTRNDWSRYSLAEVIRILNRELEPNGFRLLDRGEHLDVLALRDARREYARPVFDTRPTVAAGSGLSTQAKSVPADVMSGEPIERSTGAVPPRRDTQVRPAGFEETPEEPEQPAAQSSRRMTTVTLKHQTARQVAMPLFEAFGESAEEIEKGPSGLPGFVVWREIPVSIFSRNSTPPPQSPPQRVARFAIGIDLSNDRIVIDGPETEVGAITRLISKLDVPGSGANRTVRLVPTQRNPKQVAQTLNSAVAQLTQARRDAGPEAESPTESQSTKSKSKKSTKPAATRNPNDSTQATPKEGDRKQATGDEPPSFSGLKSDVNVEALDDVLILRGNEKDVEAVVQLIRQIEQMLAGTVPDVHLRELKHVDSESLAELLTTVYERLNRSRGRPASDATQQIVVIAVGKPNAVLVLASPDNIEVVDSLIDKLDQPVDPANEFEVFRLKYAVASQVLTAINEFFGGGTTSGGGQTPGGQGTTTSRTTSGLRGRVRAIDDSRTNSIIVQARPRDLEEVARLINELDQVGSKSVNQIKLIPLKNAVADEMAELLNLAIQSVISPPQQVRTQQGGGGFGGQVGGFGGQGQVDQNLRAAKSAILQLLDTDDGEQMLESGILADIRINSDLRTNSLVVTAPTESLPLIMALVKKFDQPASLIAEIKHFTLKNADAQSVATMLNQLFNNQQQPGAGRQGGQFGQQNQQLGIQLAGAEDASSQLIPLRLSTDVRTNSIIAVGGGEALSVVEAIILRLDQDDVRQRQMAVYRLKNSPATNVAQAITAFLQSQSDLATQGNQGLVSQFEQFEREVIVVAEANSNSLLISATPRYFDQIMDVIQGIDMDQQQVVIQALLVEVELTNNDEFGVELGLQDSLLFDRSGTATVGGVANTLVPGFNFNNQPLGNTTNGLANSNKVGGQGLSNFALGRTNSELGFGGLVLSAGSESVSVLLRALSANRSVEILSRPQIRTLDNQLGRINVGQNVPVVNGFTTQGALGQITPTVIRDDSGIILEVTPRITPDGRIVMQIGAERSNYDLQNGVTLTTDALGNQIQAPVKNISRAVSTISVANEQTVVLGGLIQRTTTTIERKVPWLGDIPVLGHAFRFDANATRRTELLIFLTPRIVKDNTVNEMIKQIEAERLHYTECEAEAMHGPLFAAPAPPTEEAVPLIYPPRNLNRAPRSQPLPTPPAPMQEDEDPAFPSSVPLPEAIDGIQGASFDSVSRSEASRSHVQPVNATRTSASKRPTILEAVRRKPTDRQTAHSR